MNAIYLDCFSGISGNMLLGAFVDCGVSAYSDAEKIQNWLTADGIATANKKKKQLAK